MDVLKSFDREEFECHIDKLQKSMAEDNLDLLILSSSGSIFYGSGYRSWYLSSLFRPYLCWCRGRESRVSCCGIWKKAPCKTAVGSHKFTVPARHPEITGSWIAPAMWTVL